MPAKVIDGTAIAQQVREISPAPIETFHGR